ncbi:MAG TPA: NDP-sugar synthase [Kofleriaceae bacterium]|jgi:NDP-sugar pyrophosphorylase family protein|nr:NDP-sugar synthase [Kofleriaceae bacterium]
MILCAGFGTRLGALSDERPKPMLPVCDVPILRYGIANLVGHGITELVINVHHRGDVIEREIGDGSRFGARIRYSREDVILGTGGGLKHALPLLDPEGDDAPFLSLNGKLIFDLDLSALVDAFARAPKDTLGMMVVRRVPDAKEWGALDVRPDEHGLRIADFFAGGEHMFCGVHVTRPSTVARLPDGEACMIRQGYHGWIKAGARVAAWEHERGYFAEHSTPRRYLESNVALLRGEALRFPPAPLRGIDPSATIAATARITEPVKIGPGAVVGDGAQIGPDAVIGNGATVAPQTIVRRAVVWAGAHASGTIEDQIVAIHGATPAT